MSSQKVFSPARSWHWHFLESIERKFRGELMLREKYDLLSSNRKRLYLPDRPGIRREEILSNPDMILVNKRTRDLGYVLEVEFQANRKKIAGIAILTDIAIGQMDLKTKPKLILVTKREFSSMELLQMEIQRVVRSIKFDLSTSDNFVSRFNSLIT